MRKMINWQQENQDNQNNVEEEAKGLRQFNNEVQNAD